MPPSDLHGYKNAHDTQTHMKEKILQHFLKSSLNILSDIFAKYINSNQHFL